jgi:cell cycle arrest protein BUB3
MTSEIRLDPHTDGISSVRFSPEGSRLLVTSWDGGATLYLFETGEAKVRHANAGAVLCGAFGSGGVKCYSAGLDRVVRELDVGSEAAPRVLGKHDSAVRVCEWAELSNVLVTGSWDRTAKLFDPRSATPEVASVHLPERIFAMDVFEHLALFAVADGSLNLYDVRSMEQPISSRVSTIGHQIRCTRIFDRGTGVLIGSIEGRVAVENLDVSQPVAKRYAFKCHRVDETVYPVNTIAVRSEKGTQTPVFATGGGDATVVLWDASQKKRLLQYPDLETSCSYVDFSRDGNFLAIASSYTYDRGDIPHPKDKLLIVEVSLPSADQSGEAS